MQPAAPSCSSNMPGNGSFPALRSFWLSSPSTSSATVCATPSIPAPISRESNHRHDMASFSGVIPPVVTPLNDDFTVDYPSYTRVLEHLIAGGVHGLFV